MTISLLSHSATETEIMLFNSFAPIKSSGKAKKK